MTVGRPGWSVQWMVGDAETFHGRDPSEPPHRQIWVVAVDRPALVLGSTQPRSDVDVAAARRMGVQVVRRRSGGGAVLLDPGGAVWIDAVVPRDDPLWHDDVGRAFAWLGEAWAGALVDLGVATGRVGVHEGALVSSVLSPVVCFAGLGPGEVTVGGAKAVGISQRRTRGWARLQSSALLDWDVDRHGTLLAPGLERVAGGDGLARLADLAVAPLSAAPRDVVEALVHRLPAPP